MKVLVTGGSGVIGEGLLPELLRRGHRVRLLARGADDAVEQWPREVEPRAGDVTDPGSIRGAADGCDAVVHITGIVGEQPPEITFDAVNVGGTANVLAEAARAGAPRFIFISSLGADRGSSAYHRSKRGAERLVAEYKGPWTILRPGNVYGPGDDVLSRMVQIARALPVMPLVGDGDQPFQPLWFEDFGRAVADAVERDDLAGRTLELAGEETTTMRDVLERLNRALDRSVRAVPTPEFAASVAAGVTESLGIEFPLTESKLAMLLEGNTVRGENAALTVFGIDPMPLDDGLRRLADILPEEPPSDGVGPMEQKRFWADIEGKAMTPEDLMTIFRREYPDLFAIEVGIEGDANGELREGERISMKLPLRGNIRVRVEEITPREVTFVTVEGHPLAGAVSFRAEPVARGVRFLVEVHARAASWVDYLTFKAGGNLGQRINWQTVVERMVERSGGEAPEGVRHEKQKLDDEDADRAEGWIERMIARRRRKDHTEAAHRDRAR